MVVHIGIDPLNGKVEAFDSSSIFAKTANFQTIKVNKNGIKFVDEMFKDILSKISGIRGCCCIILWNNYANEIRKKFVDRGLFYGFQKVQLIYDIDLTFYLEMVSQLKFWNDEYEVIWIFYKWDCAIWRRKNGKMCLETRFYDVTNRTSKERIEEIKKESGIDKDPNAIFYPDPYKPPFHKMFPKCYYIPYSRVSDEAAALIKARMMGNEKGLENLDPETILDDTFFLHFDPQNNIGKGTLLPTKKVFFVDPQKNNKIMQLGFCNNMCGMTDFLEDALKQILVFLTVDVNQIYTIEILDITNHTESEIESMKAIFENFDAAFENNINIPQTYFLPPKFPSLNEQNDAVGIDLGTSRCCCAVSRIETVDLENTGGRLLDSYVSFDEKTPKCGKIVITNLRFHAKSSVFDVKRIIGTHFKMIKMDSIWPFTIEQLNVEKIQIENEKEQSTEQNNNQRVGVKLCGPDANLYKSPEHISAVLLQHIKRNAEDFQGTKSTKAVITVPVAFNELQNKATILAAKLAGWETVTLLPEPVAAVFGHFADSPIPINSTLLVFDLGGGTLDVCIFKIKNNNFEIASRSGNLYIGGRDFDNHIIEYVKQKISQKYNVTVAENKKYKLMSECQSIKECLSTEDIANFDLDFIDPSFDSHISITRKEFEEMSGELLLQIRQTIMDALGKKKYIADDIDQVLYAGGGSRMPMIKKLLTDIFPNTKIIGGTNPDEIVAKGAAHYAYYLNLSIDKKSKSAQIQLPKDRFLPARPPKPAINRNVRPIPAKSGPFRQVSPEEHNYSNFACFFVCAISVFLVAFAIYAMIFFLNKR